jgi:hypothetical protein
MESKLERGRSVKTENTPREMRAATRRTMTERTSIRYRQVVIILDVETREENE